MNASEKDVSVADWRGRLWRYGPLALWVGFIFFASSGNLSASNTSRIIGPLLRWLFPDISEPELQNAHSLVRKTAHFVEYALLALLAARAYLTSSSALLRHRWLSLALLLVTVVALLDELNQSYVATRTGTIYDSMIDVAGGAFALSLVYLWRRTRERGIKKRDNKT